MLTGGLDQLYRDALAGSHRQVTRVEVWRDGVRIDPYRDAFDDDGYGGVPILGGSVSASLRSRVTRTLNLTLSPNLVPYLDDEAGLLTPYGNRLRVLRGIELGDGTTYMWPVFTGMIATVADGDSGTVELTATDRAGEVDRAKFRTPRSSSPGATVRAQVIELIQDAVPDATFDIDPTFAGQTVPPLTWEYDRARGLDELATAVGAFWWALPEGRFTLRPVPWAVLAEPTVTLAEIRDPIDPSTAIVHSALGSVSNENVINSVTAYGERLDGSTPVTGFAEHLNPASPTRADGPIGRRHKLVRLQTPTTDGAAQGAAAAYLKRGVALGEEWSWRQVPDAAMELGEPVLLVPKRRRTPVVQVVSGYTMPLDVNAQMSVTGRAMVVGVSEGD